MAVLGLAPVNHHHGRADSLPMGAAREVPPVPQVFGGENARRGGRVRVEMVSSSLGDVLDVSSTGMRVRCKGGASCQKGDELVVRLEALTRPVDIKARVAWVRRTGFRRRELGLEFCEVPAEVRRELAQLARTAPLNTTLNQTAELRRSA
jgi:hypothetical protein